MNRRQSLTSMKTFFGHRTKRNTTCAASRVWPFALGSGTANACLPEEPDKRLHPPANHPPDVLNVQPSTGLAISSNDDQDISEESCLRARENGANTPVKLQIAVDAPEPGLVPFTAIVWGTAAPSVSAPHFVGIRISLEKVITERLVPTVKVRETIGTPKLLAISHHRMSFELTPQRASSPSASSSSGACRSTRRHRGWATGSALSARAGKRDR